MRIPSTTFLRSLVVSGFTTALELSLFGLGFAFGAAAGGRLVLLRWGAGLVGAVANFALNRNLVFAPASKVGTKTRHSSAIRYAVTALTAVTLSTILWETLVALTRLDVRLLHPVSMAVVWLIFTFPTMKRWVFRRPLESPRPQTCVTEGSRGLASRRSHAAETH